MEVDVLSRDLPAQFRRYGLLPEGSSPAPIDPQYRDAVEAALHQLKIDPEFASRFKPDVLAATLGIASARRLGLTPDYSVESFLIGFARALAIPVVELEGLQAQLTLNDKLQTQERQQILDQAVKAMVSGESLQSVRRAVRAWRQHDLDALSALDNPPEQRAAHEQLANQIGTRNEAMAEAITARLTPRSRLFVAVGIFHFVGQKSLQAMLQQRGFRVERVY